MPGISNAAVVVRGEAEHRHLVAYLRNGGSALAAVRQHLHRVLPSYMVPAHFVVLEELPLTSSGKVDRRALPETRGSLGRRDGTALTPTEELLAALWCQLLRREAVGPDGNFFELGAMLRATQLMSRIRDAFGVMLPLTTIFTAQTIRELARQIEALSPRPVLNSAIPPASRDDLLPLSFAQERLWFLHKLEPDNPFYNTPLALHLRGPLDKMALQAALQGLLNRHEVLRTAFVDHDGRPRSGNSRRPGVAARRR